MIILSYLTTFVYAEIFPWIDAKCSLARAAPFGGFDPILIQLAVANGNFRVQLHLP